MQCCSSLQFSNSKVNNLFLKIMNKSAELSLNSLLASFNYFFTKLDFKL